jgi:hypothetical protein
MWRNSVFLVVYLVFSIGSASGAEPEKDAGDRRLGTLEIIPTDAVAAIAIRNVKELTKRGDALIEKAEIKSPMRLSEGYAFVTMFLGIRRGLDEEGTAVLMAYKTELTEDAQRWRRTSS